MQLAPGPRDCDVIKSFLQSKWLVLAGMSNTLNNVVFLFQRYTINQAESCTLGLLLTASSIHKSIDLTWQALPLSPMGLRVPKKRSLFSLIHIVCVSLWVFERERERQEVICLDKQYNPISHYLQKNNLIHSYKQRWGLVHSLTIAQL